MATEPQTQYADRAIRMGAVLIAVTLALIGVFARWVPSGSAFEPIARWVAWFALLACAAWMGAAVAQQARRGHFAAFLYFVLLLVLLYFAGFLVDCTLRPGGCDV